MKKLMKIIIYVLSAAFIVGILGSAIAEETEEQLKYSGGTINSITDKAIVISEYDPDEDIETNVVYVIDPEIKLEGVASLGEIAADDYVDITYIENAGQNVIQQIIVEKEEDFYVEE